MNNKGCLRMPHNIIRLIRDENHTTLEEYTDDRPVVMKPGRKLTSSQLGHSTNYNTFNSRKSEVHVCSKLESF